MDGFFSKLKEKLFGKEKNQQPKTPLITPDADKKKPARRPEPAEVIVPKKESPKSKTSVSTKAPPPRKREPYFIQIGLDFGTAFCKCVCRDMLLDKAWVHMLPDTTNKELPFLVASAIHFDGVNLQHINNSHGSYESGGLYHIKMALQKVGLKEWDDPTLLPYHQATLNAQEKNVATFVSGCSVYLIAGIIGNIKKEVSARYPGKVEGDYLAINMAVPVADANHPKVCDLFERVLRFSWVLADELAGHPAISYKKLLSLIAATKEAANNQSVTDACYIYPEVSANVQGFVRSRTSSPGLYIFSDTGAGTVDQSVFLFNRRDGDEHLAYLHAGVFPLGSSYIERLAAQADGDLSTRNLERWRQKKEMGEKQQSLLIAKKFVHEQLIKGTTQTIALSKKKLYSKKQINDLRVLFGGGGHCENPYRIAVTATFNGGLFHPDMIRQRQREGVSFDLGMPIPNDLPLKASQRRWMDRLSVAYGLSFEKGQLATFRLPKDIDIPTEEQIWRPVRRIPGSPTKDDV